MSRLLEEYVPPPPAAAPSCPSCRTFAPECLVPAEALGYQGVPPVPMCWLCAHAVTEHGATLENAVERAAACGCGRSEIFPAEVVARRDDRLTEHTVTRPPTLGKTRRGGRI